MPSNPTPPTAKTQPKLLTHHGTTRPDLYYWLHDHDDPDVLAYLHAENAYTKTLTAHTKRLQDRLFEEIRGRIKQTDMSVPYKLDDYLYYTRYEDGREYPIHARRFASMDADERVLLDVNELAQGYEFYSVGARAVSYEQNILAYAFDTVGRRVFAIRFRDLDSGVTLQDTIPNVTNNLAWANDNRTLFYAKQDPDTLRWYQIFRHELGTDSGDDQLVYEEPDEEFSCFIFRTKSKAYLLIGSHQTESSEYRFLDANRPHDEFALFQERQRHHEYQVEHYQNAFYIRTNDGATNFRLMKTPTTRTARDAWTEVIPHRPDVFLREFEIFTSHLVLAERHQGLPRLRVLPWSGAGEHYIDFDEPTYAASIDINPDFDTPLLRFSYESMTTPRSVFDYHMTTRDRTLLKQEEVLGGFDEQAYETQRVYATAVDGTQVPMSVVYRKDTALDGSAPAVLYGYGSYGLSLDATFSSPRLSLLDRGFVFAIAHVRGGQEVGRPWYDAGRLLNKKNTFTDFARCGESLIETEVADARRLYAWGGSAGGLLIGAVSNMWPDLFHGLIAEVPFVDVATTMLDPSIPLTTSEYDEWGDPNDPLCFEYILSYSPYDNVEAKVYPHMLVTTGLHDSQVQYWEPAKWVAKLRAMKTDQNVLLLETNMDAGHGGASGRYKRYRELAFRYAFLIDLASAAEQALSQKD